MMIPIHIGYKTYQLNYIPSHLGDSHGICLKDKGQIYIDEDLSPDDKINTIVHEILHAVFHAYAIEASDEVEERHVLTLANGITEVVLRNPQLLKELSKLAKKIR